MRLPTFAAGAITVLLLGVRLKKSRHRRSLHPAGRSFTGELEIWGSPSPTGSNLLDEPGRYPVTVRISKGVGTRGSRPDVLGVAVRIPDRGTDLLLSTAGTNRVTRHLPAPRRSFDARYGSILAYRTGAGRKVYLAAASTRSAPPLGRTLDTVAAVALTGRAELAVFAEDVPVGRVTFGPLLPPSADAALAFDPIRNATADLRPTGAIHRTRRWAYRASHRWRNVPRLPVS